MVKVVLICPYCGSEDIVRDGPLTWNVEKQEWVSECGYVYDDMACNACGEDFKEAAEKRAE